VLAVISYSRMAVPVAVDVLEEFGSWAASIVDRNSMT